MMKLKRQGFSNDEISEIFKIGSGSVRKCLMKHMPDYEDYKYMRKSKPQSRTPKGFSFSGGMVEYIPYKNADDTIRNQIGDRVMGMRHQVPPKTYKQCIAVIKDEYRVILCNNNICKITH